MTFSWTPVSGAADYWIDVGTAPGQGNIAGSGYTGAATSKSVDLSAWAGQMIFVQLYSKFPGESLVPGTGNRFYFSPTTGGTATFLRRRRRPPRRTGSLRPGGGGTASRSTSTFLTAARIRSHYTPWIGMETTPAA